jgi:predicted ester cyclase
VIEAFLDYGRRVEGMAFGEDECVLRWGLLGTARGSALGMEPTGKRIDVPMASFFSFKDGRIECERRLFDVATLCDQAGIPIERVRGPVNIGA